MANYTIGSTPAADANKLQWHKIKDGNKTLLICDRVILVSVSWNDLNAQGYITGKTIAGRQQLPKHLRLLCGRHPHQQRVGQVYHPRGGHHRPPGPHLGRPEQRADCR